jgi:hypothetical protein
MSFQPPVQDLIFCIEHLPHREKVSAFMARKTATASFFARHNLPGCAAGQTRIPQGAQSLLDAAFPE